MDSRECDCGDLPLCLIFGDTWRHVSCNRVAGKNGVLIRNGKAIQAMAEATHFVFDKTGTLTVGKLRVSDTMILRA
jgi:P-type E1-E2 ATPase